MFDHWPLGLLAILLDIAVYYYVIYAIYQMIILYEDSKAYFPFNPIMYDSEIE